jgi:anti-sigma B factor antagonist
MILTTEKINDIFTINLKGEIDASSSLELDKKLEMVIKNGYKKILVNCKDLDYISSAGLGVFTSYVQDIHEKNIKMILCALKENVYEVFCLLGLDSIIPIVNTIDEAMEKLND